MQTLFFLRLELDYLHPGVGIPVLVEPPYRLLREILGRRPDISLVLQLAKEPGRRRATPIGRLQVEPPELVIGGHEVGFPVPMPEDIPPAFPQ